MGKSDDEIMTMGRELINIDVTDHIKTDWQIQNLKQAWFFKPYWSVLEELIVTETYRGCNACSKNG
jgi:hypothetical protein